MKNSDPNADRDPLSRTLRDWRVTTPLPAGFREQVWSRIARTQQPARPSISTLITHWIGTVLPRPALAASYVAIVLVVGVTAGWAQGRRENARMKDELGQRYIQVLDPYQAPRQ
ncbi:MAG: hypothetical protein ABI651_04030 [Verrucomicrobiota bacterium]